MLEFEKSKMCIIRSAFITMYWIMLHCHSQGCHSNPVLATLNYIYICIMHWESDQLLSWFLGQGQGYHFKALR